MLIAELGLLYVHYLRFYDHITEDGSAFVLLGPKAYEGPNSLAQRVGPTYTELIDLKSLLKQTNYEYICIYLLPAQIDQIGSRQPMYGFAVAFK